MKKIFLISAVASIFILASCDEDINACDGDSIVVTVVDWTGFDGCGIVLTTDSTNFEVFQWPESCEYTVGEQLCITYNETPGASICMIGPMITVTSCQKIEE